MILTKSNGLLTTAFLIVIGVNVVTFAQQFDPSEGIVRISDNRGAPRTRPTGGNGIQQTSADQNAGTLSPVPAGSNMTNGGTWTQNCPTGNCPAGGDWDQGYCPHCRRARGGRCREHYCKHSPDYGYSPPAKYPLHRTGVEYSNYYPAHWYGTGNDYVQSNAPMVYQPTDTTQLGFYYQHVPFWQPQPGRLPPRPIPSEWNIVAPPVSSAGIFGHGSGYGCPDCWGNGYYDGNMGPRRTLFGSRMHRHSLNGYGMSGYDMGVPCSPTPTPVATPAATQPGPATPPDAPADSQDGVAPAPIQTAPSPNAPPAAPRPVAPVPPGTANMLPPVPGNPSAMVPPSPTPKV